MSTEAAVRVRPPSSPAPAGASAAASPSRWPRRARRSSAWPGTRRGWQKLREQLGDGFTPVAADAADPVVAGAPHRRLPARASWCLPPARPRCPGRCTSTPGRRSAATGRSTCSRCSTGPGRRCCARCAPGSAVIAMSSGAALRGSPLSGGYAGAKATDQVRQPPTPPTSPSGPGSASGSPRCSRSSPRPPAWARRAVAAYARRAGTDLDTFIREPRPGAHPGDRRQGDHRPDRRLRHTTRRSYLLTAAGLRPLD